MVISSCTRAHDRSENKIVLTTSVHAANARATPRPEKFSIGAAQLVTNRQQLGACPKPVVALGALWRQGIEARWVDIHIVYAASTRTGTLNGSSNTTDV